MPILLILFLLSLPQLRAQTLSNHQRLLEIKELKRFSFGSCNNQTDSQPLWEDLINQRPDLWIWAGDSVYADWMSGYSIENAYAFQNKNPHYSLFKKQTPIIGTWDDHDYAYDNADGSFSGKVQSQKRFLDFINIPEDSSLRAQEGVYNFHSFGPLEREIKIILLDNRYFKNLDPDYPMLGKVQWEWLEGVLTQSSAKIHFIVTGLPVTSPLIPYTEEWAETSELRHMLELLKRTQAQGVVFLTGDKHFSSIYRRWGHLEFMSSGMTHLVDRNAWFYLGKKFPKTFFGLSYGQIDIKWKDETPVLRMSMRSTSGKDIHDSSYILHKNKWETLYK
jgi:alkaline phosphatase D